MKYSVVIEDDTRRELLRLDRSLTVRLLKKLTQLEREDVSSRHLHHGLPYFVEEVSGFRIVFAKDDELRTKRVLFIGDHKEYEKWFRSVEP